MRTLPMNPAAPTANDRAIAALRIALGVLFLIFASWKLSSSTFVFGTGPLSNVWWLEQFIARNGAYPFMVPLIQDVFKPNATVLAAVVAVGELAIGLSLLSGVAVRWASAFGVVFMLLLMLCTNYPGPTAPWWQYFGRGMGHLMPAICFAVLCMAEPGRAWAWRPAALRARAAEPAAS